MKVQEKVDPNANPVLDDDDEYDDYVLLLSQHDSNVKFNFSVELFMDSDDPDCHKPVDFQIVPDVPKAFQQKMVQQVGRIFFEGVVPTVLGKNVGSLSRLGMCRVSYREDSAKMHFGASGEKKFWAELNTMFRILKLRPCIAQNVWQQHKIFSLFTDHRRLHPNSSTPLKTYSSPQLLDCGCMNHIPPPSSGTWTAGA